MALISFDDLFFPQERYSLTPYRQYHSQPRHYYPPTAGVLSTVLNDGFRELQRLERELGDVERNVNNDPNSLVFRCNVAGYRPEELKVDMENNELVIQGEHKHEGDGQSIHRTFIRRLTLPDGVERESIECNLNEKGQLEVKAQRKAIDEPKKHNIPIGFKQSSPPAAAVQNDTAVAPPADKTNAKGAK